MLVDPWSEVNRAARIALAVVALSLAQLGLAQGAAAQEDKSLQAQQEDFSRRMEAPFQELKGLQEQIKNLEIRRQELEEAIAEAKDNPEARERREAIAELIKQRDELKDQMPRRGNWSAGPAGLLNVFGQLSQLGMVAGLAIFFFLTAYLLRYKKHIAFKHDWASMRTALYRLVLPRGMEARGGGGQFLKRACLIMGALVLLLGLILLGSQHAWAQAAEGATNIPPWDPYKLSFGEGADNLSTLAEADEWGRVAFVLEHPQDRFILKRYYARFLAEPSEPLPLIKPPALRFAETSFPTNSYEHLFLLGRVYYERGELDKALHYFGWARDIQAHPFASPSQAQRYLLNQLKIVLSQNKELEYQDLIKVFLENARPDLRYELVRYISTKVDAAKGLKLFERLVANYPSPALTFLDDLFTERGPETLAPFWEVYVSLVQTRTVATGPAIDLLMRAYRACNPQSQAVLRDRFRQGLKKILEQTNELALKLPGYRFLLETGERAFVTQCLKADLQAKEGDVALELYLQAVGLIYDAGDVDIAATHLEEAYNKHYTSASALGEILMFCLKRQLYAQASRVVEKVMENYPSTANLSMKKAMIHRLPLAIPAEDQGLSVRGFSALLHYQLKNYQSCRMQLEEALKDDIASALRQYNPDPALNLNEFYYLLLTYKKLDDWARISEVLPLFERVAQSCIGATYKARLQAHIDQLREEIETLERSKEAAALSNERAQKRMEELRDEIGHLGLVLRWNSFLDALASFAGKLLWVISGLWWLAVLWYALCRGAFFATRGGDWRLSVFTIRIVETLGLAQLLTLLCAPIGLLLVLFSQLALNSLTPKKQTAAPTPPDVNDVISALAPPDDEERGA